MLEIGAKVLVNGLIAEVHFRAIIGKSPFQKTPVKGLLVVVLQGEDLPL